MKTINDFLKPSRSCPNVMKIDCRNILESFKGVFDVSMVLLQNAFATPARLSVTPRIVSNLQDAQRLLLWSIRPWTDYVFPSFDNRCCRFVFSDLSSSASRLTLKFPYRSSKAEFGLPTFARWRYFVLQIGYYTAKIHGCDQNRTAALMCAKNHVSWFGRFEAGGSQM